MQHDPPPLLRLRLAPDPEALLSSADTASPMVRTGTPMNVLHYTVHGLPIGQGRLSFFGRGRAVHSNHKTLEPWREQVAAATRRVTEDWPMQVKTPIFLVADFYLPRPKTHFTSKGVLRANAPAFPVVRPDLDHLVRAVCDGITMAGTAIADDSQIVRTTSSKNYCSGRITEPCAVLMLATLTFEENP